MSCFQRVWEKLLNTSVSSIAFPGQCVSLSEVLNHYSDESKNSVWVNLMNEPNMVETAHVAEAYAEVIKLMRGPKNNMQNHLLIEGN